MMPTFRTTPSGNLTNSIRRLLASGGDKLSPLQEVQADSMAASTARTMSLAEKARAEVEAMRRGEAQRNDPGVRTEYAAHAAGIDMPDATRLYKAIAGTRERPMVEMDDEGNSMPDVTYAKPENLPAGSERVFRSALAAAVANNLATGKTNAAQLAQASDRTNETALTSQAANTADVPAANQIIAAVAGKIREPFKVGPQGQVLNEETGGVNEGTALARAAATLSAARTGTEGTRQTRNTAAAGLATERAGAVARGETNRGGARTSPQQVERWVSEVARKEWEAIPAKERKGMNYAQHLEKVRERFKPTSSGAGAQDEVAEAHAAIAKGADAAKVGKRFKERMGFDMPTPKIDEQDAVDLLDDDDEED